MHVFFDGAVVATLRNRHLFDLLCVPVFSIAGLGLEQFAVLLLPDRLVRLSTRFAHLALGCRRGVARVSQGRGIDHLAHYDGIDRKAAVFKIDQIRQWDRAVACGQGQFMLQAQRQHLNALVTLHHADVHQPVDGCLLVALA